MTAPFERIVLLKLTSAHASPGARETLARGLAATLGDRASVGLPADVSAEKSWDVSIVLRCEDLDTASTLDVPGLVAKVVGVPSSDVVEVVKGWTFRTL